MRFEVTHRIQGTANEVEQSLLDERYAAFLLQHHGVLLEVEPIERVDEGSRVRRKIRYRPKPVISSIGPKPVPPEWFAFVESSTYDRATKTLTFQNVPTSNKIAHLLTNTGTIRLKDLGNGQTERHTEGDITIKLPFLMKPLALIAEKVIQSEGVKILDGEVKVLERFISEVLRKAA